MSELKDDVIEMIKALPDDCSVEDIQYHLYVREKVLRGLRAAQEGRSVPHEQVKQMVQQWLESSGQTRH